VGQHETVIENRRFGTYLRKVREERKLSLDAVEELSLGLPERVTKSHLSRIENGQAIPTFPRIFTLSQIYGIPVGHLAERFEICLKQAGLPRAALREPIHEVLEEARMFRVAGRHAEALTLFEVLLHRADETENATRQHWIVELRLECINCLVKLAREATAKEECERLLASPWLSARQRVIAFQYFAICCYRMGKFTVAMMAIDRAESEIGTLEDAEPLAAHLSVLKGNLLFATKQFAQAADAFRDGLKQFDGLANRFEACRAKLNLAASLIELGSRSAARDHLKDALRTAESGGYDRQRAFALSHLGMLAFREEDLKSAEAHCLRSNRLARVREYVSILFRNCYYLWRIAQLRKDDAGTKTNERTLRTYLSRVEKYMPEAEDFRAYLGGGDAHE